MRKGNALTRTLTLKLLTEPKTGALALTVTHAETTGDDGAVEKHSVTETDTWGTEAAATEAVQLAVDKYFELLETDRRANLTPIERAAKDA